MKAGQRGQVTIPREIREQFGIGPETEVELRVPRGEIRLRKSPRKLLDILVPSEDFCDASAGALEAQVLPMLGEPVRYSPELRGRMRDLIQSVKAQRLEGLIAKRRDSLYEPGKRSGAWLKMRVNRGQEFVIGGYTVGGATFDALIFGYYDGDDLIYAARTRSGFTPKTRAELTKAFRSLEIEKCPFANLPEQHASRWGVGLTAAKMADCHWLLCRIRHSSHNVECRTMPNRLLPLLSFLRSASFGSA
jgi:AbrB family looped-hinge helix DNA binding protein